MPGVFITFEGGEGTGKSSHARDLAEALRKSGRTVVLTREPGGSPSAEEVRALLVTGAVGRWSADAEALLNYAARDSHLRETIRPALVRGDLVLCDRFMDSSRAYQGFAGGGDMALIDTLEQSCGMHASRMPHTHTGTGLGIGAPHMITLLIHRGV